MVVVVVVKHICLLLWIVIACGKYAQASNLGLNSVHRATCKIRCRHIDHQDRSNCLSSCLSDDVKIVIKPFGKIADDRYFNLLCKDVYMNENNALTAKMYLNIVDSNSSDEYVSTKSVVYVTEIRTNRSDWTVWDNVLITGTILELKDLRLSSTYQFRVTVIGINGLYGSPLVSESFMTLSGNEELSPPSSVFVDRMEKSEDPRLVDAKIEWNPSPEMFCNYDVHWFTDESVSLGYQSVSAASSDPFTMWAAGLRPDMKYSLTIASKMVDGILTGANTTELEFRTPDCLQLNNNSFNECAPGRVQSLRATFLNRPDENATLEVHWAPPLYSLLDNNVVDGYRISVRRHVNVLMGPNMITHHLERRVNSNVTEAVFDNLLKDSRYSVDVWASSTGGQGVKSSVTVSTYANDVSAQETNRRQVHLDAIIVGIVTGACFLIVAVVASLFWWRRCKNKHKQSDECADYGKMSPSVQYVPMDIPNEKNGYEVDIRRIVKIETVGQGSFGVVYRGHLAMKNSIRRVAIKTLKSASTEDDRLQLCEEIELLRSVGHHPNIVNIVACCTDTRGTSLLMEYCPLGDLRSHLLKVRNDNDLVQSVGQSGDDVSADGVSYFDLVSYSRQVALGMEYLASQKIVHRDLAARNILVKSKKIVKITDFGLARDVYERGHYNLKSDKKLPLKWMAIESIFDHVFSTKSDVWSYGILLWEIMTLGATPYPGITGIELIPHLKEGYRMSKPLNCIDEIYRIMESCWRTKPSSRPTFGELRKQLDAILEATMTYLSFDLYDTPIDNRFRSTSNIRRTFSLMNNLSKKQIKSVFDKKGRSVSELVLMS